MSILNDIEIKRRCTGSRKPMLTPFLPEKVVMGSLSGGLSYFGYDIHISGMLRKLHPGQGVRPAGQHAGLSKLRYTDIPLDGENSYLKPGDFALVSTLETFDLPSDIVGQLADKSTLARLGLSVFNTVAEPGWKGILTVELSNKGPLTIYLDEGMPIGQMIFKLGTGPASKLYEGRYQNQNAGTGAQDH